MNFKIFLLLLIFIIGACGVQGRPRAKDETKFKPFNKIYQQETENEKNKKDKNKK